MRKRREGRGQPRTRRGAGLRSGVRRSLLGVWIAGAVVAGAVPAGAQIEERPNSVEAERAISQLRSPYCPGFMLEVCPSPQAEALRDSIYDLAAQGMTSDELVEWMIANHGEEWRGMPRRSGAGLLAWVIPPLALLVGIGAFYGWLKANRSRTPSGPEETPPVPASALSETEREKLSAALREWEETGHEEV